MKRIRYNILVLLLPLLLLGCTREEIHPDIDGQTGDYILIDFGQKGADDITITTRATMDESVEMSLLNIYAIMFDNAGKRIYGHFFFYDERKESIADFTEDNCWYVDNPVTDDADPVCTGTVKMKKPDDVNGARLYFIGNVDPAVINLSEDKLHDITTEKDLKDLILGFNQETAYRTGNMLMVGSAKLSETNNAVSVVYEQGKTTEANTDGKYKIVLQRVDAKVKFEIGIVPGFYEKGDGKYEALESFTPTSWQVINLPKKAYFLEREKDAVENKNDYFDTEEHLFETKRQQTDYVYPEGARKDGTEDGEDISGQVTSRTLHGFSFYMLENRQTNKLTEEQKAALTGTNKYHLRDKRNKDPETGAYTEDPDDMWKYAPENSTYLIVKGEIRMKVNETSSAEGTSQTLNANVTYYIHLGDIKTSFADFDVCRNTSYTYKINLKGVDKIELEVVKDNSGAWSDSNEEESGATGEVYIAQETIYTFDAHYGQRVFNFRFPAILKTLFGDKYKDKTEFSDEEIETIMEAVNKEFSWAVYTPYGRQGQPDLVNGVDVPNGLDYKWVHFLINDINTTGLNSVYSDKNQWYPGSQWKGKVITSVIENNATARGKTLMNVSQLCTYLRQEIYNKLTNQASAFDKEDKITVTAFVDEFYYDVDPVSETYRENLWRSFVNQPMRMMHILCSDDVSRDEASSATGSVVTIRQRSIQTIYNTELATEGWGSETVDEIVTGTGKDRKSVGFFYTNDIEDVTTEDLGNNSMDNGWDNTIKLWGVNESDDKDWSIYVDYTKTNGEDINMNFMTGDNNTLRYSCMMRNRDEDGDGKIDVNEVKWYLAATNQLITLFVGDLGLSTEAQLYNIENPTEGSIGFRSHVISSTAYAEGNCSPQRIWSEEGCSISQYKTGWGAIYDLVDLLSVRCVRNLGDDFNQPKDIPSENRAPESPIKVSGTNPYTIDMSLLNSQSKRIKVSEELVPLDELSDMSRVYEGFETGPIGTIGGQGTSYSVNDGYSVETSDSSEYSLNIYTYLLDGKTYCPKGYHVPNIREAAVMQFFIPKDNNNPNYAQFWAGKNEIDAQTIKYYATVSYYHLGVKGLRIDKEDNNKVEKITWTYGKNYGNDFFTLAQNMTPRYVRCIRDIDP